MRFLIRLAVAAPIAIGASLAIAATMRVCVADRLASRHTIDELERAARLTPENPEYRARIAVLSPARREDLRAALQLNPQQPSLWIMLAVMQEEDGEVKAAEESLLEANRVSRYFVPRWSMAAFEYRQKRPDEFLRWGKAAIETETTTPDSLFQMADKLEIAPDRVLDEMCPQTPAALGAYLRYLITQNRVSDVHSAAARVTAAGDKARQPEVLQALEMLYEAGRTGESVDLWNRLVEARWIGFSALDPAKGASVTNGGFQKERLERGFDWRYSSVPGVSFSQAATSGGLAIQFSGDQPENCDLLNQYLPLAPGARYQLVVRYRAQEIAPRSGLRWAIAKNREDRFAARMPIPGESDGGEAKTSFTTPAEPGPLKLTLEYRREPGTTRITGTVWIDSMQLRLLP